ncbi:MAG: DUF4118 domain-containing protein [Acidobacteria bacterium]|nr:DUF4118 domain-containing protein [Acidobacteriota bacterium]
MRQVSWLDVRAATLSLAAVGVATLAYSRWLQTANATTVALTLLLVVLVTAATSRLVVAVVASLAAMLCFNFFFLPPVGTWTIADPQNWVALVVFLLVSLIASRLSHEAAARTAEAVGRRDELARLFDLGRDVLLMTPAPDAATRLAGLVGRRFDLSHVMIALPDGNGWSVASVGGQPPAVDARALTEAFDEAGQVLEFDARSRTYAGHRRLRAGGVDVSLVPLRVGTRPIGLLATSGRPVEAGTLDTLAGIVAIAVERMRLLEDRQAAEVTRQSEALKTTLLASLAHDLRTPLTSIRVAASNLRSSWLTEQEREEQGDLVLEQVRFLTQLFGNVLDMARIDAGALERTTRWTHPSEIIAAAQDQAGAVLSSHRLVVDVDADPPVQLDARLTASALTQVLLNAAQYAPAGSAIEVSATVDDTALRLSVRDHGPGIAPDDVPHIFERFYRGGAAASQRASGSGLGLWIAQGLLAAEQGHLWADNCPDGGARFTMAVPHAPIEPTLARASGS